MDRDQPVREAHGEFSQNRGNHPLAKIIRQRSGHRMLASTPASILNHKINQTGIPSDSVKP
jgi:hypothetical protein